MAFAPPGVLDNASTRAAGVSQPISPGERGAGEGAVPTARRSRQGEAISDDEESSPRQVEPDAASRRCGDDGYPGGGRRNEPPQRSPEVTSVASDALWR